MFLLHEDLARARIEQRLREAETDRQRRLARRCRDDARPLRSRLWLGTAGPVLRRRQDQPRASAR